MTLKQSPVTSANRPLQTFSRWARGGMHSAELNEAAGLNRLARRGLANASQPHSAQSIVEFMLISVPLLALIFGIMEFGIAYFESTTLDYTTRNVARSVQVCAGDCDITKTVMYRDYYALKTLRASTLDLDRVDYVLLQHVGEQDDVPVAGPGAEDVGRIGPDIYLNYKYHYQLYAAPHAAGSGKTALPARSGGDPENLYLTDATTDQVGLSLPTNGNTVKFNGWRSHFCDPPSDPGCRQDTQPAKPDGSLDTSPTAKVTNWPGRYACVPTDRFYVQIAFKHYWITPFMPTIDTTSNKPTLQGYGAKDAVILSSKVYQKIEPIFYATGSSTCQVRNN